jgi:hypothetical protein
MKENGWLYHNHFEDTILADELLLYCRALLSTGSLTDSDLSFYLTKAVLVQYATF